MSEIYNAQGDYDKAIKASNKAIQLNRSIKEAWYNQGLALYNKGLFDQALEPVEKALNLDSKYSDALILKKEILTKIS